jgi:hypothetical protein
VKKKVGEHAAAALPHPGSGDAGASGAGATPAAPPGFAVDALSEADRRRLVRVLARAVRHVLDGEVPVAQPRPPG